MDCVSAISRVEDNGEHQGCKMTVNSVWVQQWCFSQPERQRLTLQQQLLYRDDIFPIPTLLLCQCIYNVYILLLLFPDFTLCHLKMFISFRKALFTFLYQIVIVLSRTLCLSLSLSHTHTHTHAHTHTHTLSSPCHSFRDCIHLLFP